MTKTQKEKFFFDMNVFDENGMEQRELEENKPPPVFSAQHVEAARVEGFAKGKQEGLTESQVSRDQQIAQILEKISRENVTLFEAENSREKTFEHESTKLAFALFKKLFPYYSAKVGIEDLKEAMTDILQKAAGRAEIAIEVHPGAVEDIRKHVDNIPKAGQTELKFKVQGNEALGEGDCKLSWLDGGAARNSQDLADKIFKQMEEALAADGGNVHDSGEKQESQPPEESSEEQKEPQEEITGDNATPAEETTVESGEP